MADNCIFCKIVKGEIPAEIIYESDNFIAIPDAHPKTKGHTLIITKKHFTNIIDMPDSLGSELLEVVKKVGEKKIKDGAHGFNLVNNCGEAAGQVVMHVHFHLMPRKKGEKVCF
jgi:histidine triad (HIT) family protein